MAAFLAQRSRGNTAASIQPYRWAIATPAVLGNAYGSDDFGTSTKARLTNQVVQVIARDGVDPWAAQLYAMGLDGVYYKNDPASMTGDWTQDYAFTSPQATNPTRTGLYVMQVSGVPHLVGAYEHTGDANDRMRVFRKNLDTGVYTESGAVDTGTSIGDGPTCEAVYRNVIHAMNSISGGHGYAVDPVNLTGVVVVMDAGDNFASNRYRQDMCVFEDRLFAIYYPGGVSGNTISLAEFNVGTSTWSKFDDIVTGTSSPTGSQGSMCLFVHNDVLYALCLTTTWGGWRCYVLDPGVSSWDTAPNNITTSVVPTGLRTGRSIQNERFTAVQDQDTDPTVADIWLYHAATGSVTTAVNAYKWNGPSSLMGAGLDNDPNDTGTVNYALPDSDVSGERVWTAGELDILITGYSAGLGGEIITFRVDGDAGSADKTVKFYYGTNGHATLSQCTLSGSPSVVSGSPAGTPTRNANQIESLDADGSVEYSILWLSSSDGFVVGDRVQLKPYVSV